jgi:hypothetical protein
VTARVGYIHGPGRCKIFRAPGIEVVTFGSEGELVSPGTSKPISIYQIKVTLADSQPPIWRRIQVRSDITLARLHGVLQAVMGWTDMHLHQFVIREKYYGVPDEDEVGLSKPVDEGKYSLSDVVSGENSAFAYDYDFGDNWEHELVVEKVLPPQKGVRYPLCLAGARACPPEDVGGIPGYENFREAIGDPQHPDHKVLSEWIGGSFDPEAFDLDEVNQLLRAMR